MESERCANDEVPQTKRGMLSGYLKQGLARGKSELNSALGLGPKPNVIPPQEPSTFSQLRTVEIGWHPVAGMGGKWFAEKTGLGKLITKNINHYPDPTQHWAVLVGNYCHQLWMDEHLDVIYLNEEIKRDEWHTFQVGQTSFNDQALKNTGDMVIHNMRTKRAGYNLISNNCQNFAVLMLEAIQVGGHQEFATTYAIYQRATGAGKIMDLFATNEQQQQHEQYQEQQQQYQQSQQPNQQQQQSPSPQPYQPQQQYHPSQPYDSPQQYQPHQQYAPQQQYQPTQQYQPQQQSQPQFPPPPPAYPEASQAQHHNAIEYAQQVMDQNTTKLDTHKRWWPF